MLKNQCPSRQLEMQFETISFRVFRVFRGHAIVSARCHFARYEKSHATAPGIELRSVWLRELSDSR